MPIPSALLAGIEPAARAEAVSALRHEVSRRTRAAAAVPPEQKRCPRCGEDKLLEEWGRNGARRDGLQSWCLACRRRA